MSFIRVVQADITTLQVDAIVNAANCSLLGGGGVDGAIHRRAGKELLEACQRLGRCPTGEARITQGYQLPARFVIHAVGPVWQGGDQDEEDLLSKCYKACFELASQYFIQSIAFPCISTGVYRFPKKKAARIAFDTTRKCLKMYPLISDVLFVCFSEENVMTYKALVKE
jgi:O-acetyl-ADP-ribose deacetylase